MSLSEANLQKNGLFLLIWKNSLVSLNKNLTQSQKIKKMENLNLTLIQSKLHWQDAAANLAMFEEKIWQINQATDLIILPEMFTTGFSMEAEALAEPMNLTTFKWMKQQAAQTKAVVMGSFIVKEEGHFYNRLLWMEPDGSYDHYDKRHLFRMADEHLTFSAGNRKIIKEIKGWKILPLTCYDLRFPVWSRNLNLAYDVCIFIANWPKVRRSAWNILLQARAVENLCYSVGVNRVGEDGKEIAYSGDSAVVDFKGTVLFHQTEQEVIHTQRLEWARLERYRQKFPAHLDADLFEINQVIAETP